MSLLRGLGRCSAVVLAAMLALPGCATLGGSSGPLVRAASVQPIGKHYAVTAPLDYQRLVSRDPPGQLWTVNGPLLDAVYLYGGLKPGAALLDATPDAKLPRVRAGMAAHEVAELVADTLRSTGATQVETPEIAPAPFGTLPGFRFTLRFTAADGLDYQGLALGATRGDELLLIYFAAPRLHFFPGYTAAVEKLFASVTVR